jgi:hypothetical protein
MKAAEVPRTKRTLEERIARAEEFAATWLAAGNGFAERGEKENAEQCYAKSEFWLVRANTLRGW